MPRPKVSVDAFGSTDILLYEQALQSADMAVWRWGIASSEVNLSDVFYDKTGYAHGSITSLSNFLALFDGDNKQTFLSHLSVGTIKQESFSCHINIDAPNGAFCLHFIGRVQLDANQDKQILGTVRIDAVTEENIGRQDIIKMDPAFADGLENDLRLKRLFFGTVINNTDTAIAIKNFSGHYLLLNQQFCEQFCPDINDIKRKSDFDVFDEEVALRIRHFDKSVLSELTPHTVEDTLVIGTQGISYYSMHFPLIDNNGKIYATGHVLTAVSRYQSYASQVEQQRQEISLLLDSVRANIWYLDKWGNVKHSNRQADQFLPLSIAKGKSFLEAMPFWDDPAERQRELMQVIRSGVPVLGSKEVAYIDNVEYCYSVDKVPIKDKNGKVNGVLLVMNDITQEAAKEKALRDSETRHRAFIATSADVIWCYEMEPPIDTRLSVHEQVTLIDESAKLVECNQHFATLYGAAHPADMLGSTFSQTNVGDYLAKLTRFVENDYRLLDEESERFGANGDKEYWLLTAVGTTENDKLLRMWGTSRNVTERRRYLAKMEYQASHDSLTQLPNRVALYNQIEQAIKMRHAKQTMALLIIDLDGFKEINDTLGHQAGDKLLKQLGPRLEVEMEDLPGMVARLGGDEFAIFLSSIRNCQQAVVFGHRILDAICQAFYLEGFHTEISASIGIAICPDQAQDVSTLMRYADVAMYRAKKEMIGVVIYHADQDPHSPKRLALMGELGRAIRENQLILRFQPKIDLHSGSFVGFEALLRWMHPTMGFITPGEFIPIAESTGLIHPMTAWVLENSINQCKAWYDKGIDTTISVNLSARNLLDEQLVTTIRELLERANLPPQLLEIEITESAIMVDPKRAAKALNQIHELGVQLSIDDFGTGYSSLSYLKQLPVQSLKIDYSFVISMLEEEQDRIIVKSTINLAHNLGLSVVAEGVETAAVAQELRAMECDFAQGYYFSRPIPAEEAELWVTQLNNGEKDFKQ